MTDEPLLLVDVLFSGRTVRAAPDALNELGRPRVVRLAVLVAAIGNFRSRRYVSGKNSPTSLKESVRVKLSEIDGEDAVTLVWTWPNLGGPGRRVMRREQAPVVGRGPIEVPHCWFWIQRHSSHRWRIDRSRKLPTLRGRTVVNLFFEDSTRTRISFEAAAK